MIHHLRIINVQSCKLSLNKIDLLLLCIKLFIVLINKMLSIKKSSIPTFLQNSKMMMDLSEVFDSENSDEVTVP